MVQWRAVNAHLKRFWRSWITEEESECCRVQIRVLADENIHSRALHSIQRKEENISFLIRNAGGRDHSLSPSIGTTLWKRHNQGATLGKPLLLPSLRLRPNQPSPPPPPSSWVTQGAPSSSSSLSQSVSRPPSAGEAGRTDARSPALVCCVYIRVCVWGGGGDFITSAIFGSFVDSCGKEMEAWGRRRVWIMEGAAKWLFLENLNREGGIEVGERSRGGGRKDMGIGYRKSFPSRRFR